jgi:hypothetical protein
MSDERLGWIQKLLEVRGKIHDAEGESEAFRKITEAVDALKAKEGEREQVHST